MRYKLIACEVLLRELCAVVARARHEIDFEFLEKGLHDLGGTRMRQQLQAKVDATSAATYQAVLMGYALCGNGLAGLEARDIPVVVPIAHDCIALLMGSRARYQQYFIDHAGVYFRSPGWLERGASLNQVTRTELGTGNTLDELISRYGEDNGRYLYEELHRYESTYRQLTYIQTGVEPDGSFLERSRDEAAKRGWAFDLVPGDLGWFERLVNGDWEGEDFLVVPPGHRVKARYDDRILDLEKIES